MMDLNGLCFDKQFKRTGVVVMSIETGYIDQRLAVVVTGMLDLDMQFASA